MVRTIQISSSLKPAGRLPWNFLCNIGDTGSSWFVQTMTLGWPCHVRFCHLYFCMGKSNIFSQWEYWSQTANAASMGKGNDSLFKRPGHMTKLAVMSINSKKPLQNLLLQNQWVICFETMYEALETRVYFNLFKWCVDLGLFYAKVKLGHLCSCMGKSEDCYFFGTIALLHMHSKLVHAIIWTSK